MTQNQLDPQAALLKAEAGVGACPLSELGPGEEAIVARLVAKGAIRQRLLEMGFIRGARLKVIKLAPLGDPMQLLIKGYQLTLRRDESICILVDRLDARASGPQP